MSQHPSTALRTLYCIYKLNGKTQNFVRQLNFQMLEMPSSGLKFFNIICVNEIAHSAKFLVLLEPIQNQGPCWVTHTLLLMQP